MSAEDRLARHMVDALKKHLASGKPVQLPAGSDLAWGWFCDLSAARTYHAGGPNPITWGDMAAFFGLMRQPIGPRHAALIRQMDAVWVEFHSRPAGAGRDDKTGSPVIQSRPISAALFDKLFA